MRRSVITFGNRKAVIGQSRVPGALCVKITVGSGETFTLDINEPTARSLAKALNEQADEACQVAYRGSSA